MNRIMKNEPIITCPLRVRPFCPFATKKTRWRRN